ncbi:hypothetical protein Hanom_Chr00s000001g01595791 [Helianthus anomalus]
MNSKSFDFSPGSAARKQICEKYRNEKWQPFKNWFMESFHREERFRIGKEFYKDLDDIQQIIEFPVWFINKYSHKYISVIEKNYKLATGTIVKSVFPPTQDFELKRENEEIYFSAFKKLLSNDSLQATILHINQIIKQNNYTNLCLTNISDLLHETNNKLEKYIENQNYEKGETSNTKEDNFIKVQPTIQPPPEIEDYKVKPLDQLIETIREKLSKTELNALEEEEEEFSDDTNSIKRLDNRGKSGSYNTKFANKPRQRMFYYPRPTPQDVLHEEQEYEITNSYNGKSIYEWNLDGYTDRQIYMMTHRMMMYATIAKNNQNSDSTVCKMITAGFTGQLKGWWDNYIKPENQAQIYSHVKKENERDISDAVYTLIVTIIEHFTGRWSDNSETIRTLLNGLRCNTLTSFRWYKDVFLSRVYELPENNSSHWKSKFIDGLPPLFAERVRKTLRGDNESVYKKD